MAGVRDYAGTPQFVLDSLLHLFNVKIGLDVAASAENTKCRSNYYTLNDDGLTQSWKTPTKHIAWCNPPYSDVLPWVIKAAEEASIGNSSLMLLNADFSTRWGERILECGYADIYMLRPRIQFVAPEGIKYSSNSRAQKLIHFHLSAVLDTKYYDWVERRLY